LEPQVIAVRTKPFQIEGKKILIIFIPQSFEKTHMISKDGEFAYPSPSKQKKVVLKEGTFYVRHSAKNNLANAGDLEDVIKRRISQFRDSLLDKIVKVAESPVESKIKIIDGNEENGDAEKVIIDDSPDATPIKGIGFTAMPVGNEQEIASWSSISAGKYKTSPPVEQIWAWYSERDNLKLSEKYRLNVFKFSLINNLPSFYWIQNINANEIQPFALEAIKERRVDTDVTNILRVAATLGKGFYGKALLALGKYKEQISPRLKTYPKNGLDNEYSIIVKQKGVSEEDWKAEQLKDINAIAHNGMGGTQYYLSLRKAQSIDYFLYAKRDQYKTKLS